MIQAQFEPNLADWRVEARRLLQLDTPPEQIMWPDERDQGFLFGSGGEERSTAFTGKPFSKSGPSDPLARNVIIDVATAKKPTLTFTVPKEFMTLARFVSCARDTQRWSLLYRILYRMKHETHDLLKIASDNDVLRAHHLMKAVTRDIHKMHAFVRFKRVVHEGEEIYMAWHKPEHLILREAAPFFERRFGDKLWVLLTPDLSATWNGEKITYGEGVPQHLFPQKDDFDELWKSYYSSIFNPARLKLKAMTAEMPKKYWSSLPEAEIIRELIRKAPERLEKMAQNQNHRAEVPPTENLDELYVAASACTACPLYKTANHMVPGEGPANARLMIVGEQPGDQEDLAGRPFVGPAGEVLIKQMAAAGLQRNEVYLTNAVKHFKWKPQGKVRLHQKPSGNEMHACRPWLEEEIRKIKPKVILALGATAATSVLGRLPKIGEERGRIFRNSPFAEMIVISWHPSAILRSSTPADAAEKTAQLEADLRLVAELEKS